MAVHKVPQDVEADDKFLGPLSFKQFLFGGGAVVFGYLTFLTLTKGLWPISFVFGLPAVAFAVLAFPWSREQPTELWLAARIRFLIVPRVRIWDQTGMKDLVTVRAPMRPAHVYTDGLNQGEVKSRLSALATMVDSRGWAVKNYLQDEASDRLVSGNISSDPVVTLDSPDDVMDENSGALAQQFDSKIKESESKHKSKTRQVIEEARVDSHPSEIEESNTQKVLRQQHKPSGKTKSEDFWFMHQRQASLDPSLATFSSSSVVHPGQTSDSTAEFTQDDSTINENELLNRVHEKQRRDALQTHSSHMKTLDPLGSNHSQKKTKNKAESSMKTDVSPDILNYANNNDLSVETIQRQGHKEDNLPPDEVVISLH